jgi:hypothetical protein
MSTYGKRSVILRGDPEVNEYGTATAQVNPGYLVKGVTSIAHQTGTGAVPRALALERDELGTGIDARYPGVGTGNYYYASGDRVKVGVFDSGDEATVYIASGQVISEDDTLQSAGDGTFVKGTTPGDVIARSLETVGEVFVTTAIRVQFI